MRHNLFITPEDAAGTIYASTLLHALADTTPVTIQCPPELVCLFDPIPHVTHIFAHPPKPSALRDLAHYGGVFWHQLIDARARPSSQWLWARHRHKCPPNAPPKGAYRIALLADSMNLKTPLPKRITPDPIARAKATRLLADDRIYICFAPDTNPNNTIWSLKQYAELAWRLAAGNDALAHAHILFLAPSHQTNSDDFIANVPQGQFSDYSHLTRTEMIALFARADFYIGGASLGLLAATAGLPCIILANPDMPIDEQAIWGQKCQFLTSQQIHNDAEKIAKYARELWQTYTI